MTNHVYGVYVYSTQTETICIENNRIEKHTQDAMNRAGWKSSMN